MALSETVYGIFLTVICLINLGTLTNASASWDQGDLEVKQGENVTITCTTNGIQPLGVMRIDRTRDGRSTILMDNDNIKEMYASTGRYHVNIAVDFAQQKGVLKLTYTGIRGEDAGTIGCYIRGDEENKAFININVLVPVKDVYMIAVLGPDNQMAQADGSTVHLKEEQDTGVICVAIVDGTNVAPEIKITADDMDMTSEFTQTEEPQPPSSSRRRRQSNHVLPTMKNKVSLTYITKTPDHNFHGKELTCTATNPGQPSKSASVFVDVEFRPVVQCDKYRYRARPEGSITMTCDVYANPGSTISWSFGEDKESAMLINPNQDTGTLSLSETVKSEAHVQVSLTIGSVNLSHFTNYYLDVKNDIGEEDITLSLEEGAEPEPTKAPPPKPGNDLTSKSPTTREPASAPNPQGVKGGNGAATCSAMTSLLVMSLTLTCLHYISGIQSL